MITHEYERIPIRGIELGATRGIIEKRRYELSDVVLTIVAAHDLLVARGALTGNLDVEHYLRKSLYAPGQVK